MVFLKGPFSTCLRDRAPPARRSKARPRRCVGSGPRWLRARIAGLPARGGERAGGKPRGAASPLFLPLGNLCASRRASHVSESPHESQYGGAARERKAGKASLGKRSRRISPTLATGAHTRGDRPRDASRSRRPPERLLISTRRWISPRRRLWKRLAGCPGEAKLLPLLSVPFRGFSFPLPSEALLRIKVAFFTATSLAAFGGCCCYSEGSLRRTSQKSLSAPLLC